MGKGKLRSKKKRQKRIIHKKIQIGGADDVRAYSAIDILVSELKNRNINLVIFDWDKTISKRHMYHEKVGIEGGPTIDYIMDNMDNIDDYFHLLNNRTPIFVVLVEKLIEANIKIAIASFGRCSVIGAMLDRLFGNNKIRIKFITNDMIYGGDYDNHTGYCKVPTPQYGTVAGKGGDKNNQLDDILRKTRIKNNQTLFIDDTERNLTNSTIKYVHHIDGGAGYGIGPLQIERIIFSLLYKDQEHSPPPLGPRAIKSRTLGRSRAFRGRRKRI